MKKTKVLAVICAISMFVGGCQSDPKKQIIGTWEFDEGFTITFMDDGTFLDDDGRIITGVYSFADDLFDIADGIGNQEHKYCYVYI